MNVSMNTFGSKSFATKIRQLLWAAVGICASTALAGPEGGAITDGTGVIHHAGSLTTIQQATQNMAIDWQSYNVDVNERVQYIQPNQSSLSLNRILSNSASEIRGRIDANGQVILVNPNGIFFTPDSVINVGGIIASGLDINRGDFMNGNYVFNEVLGTDGAVINSGTINAALGGNVALIGRQVKNEGVIAARLGSVNLAAGKQAVLSFDDAGLLGVRVSKAILQDELGLDPAVINNGEINAGAGQVLLTGSVSQEVFSQAVNTGGMEQANSVVVHEDGSFTLGGGADVVNSGIINVSSANSDTQAGRIALLGENVASSGELVADVLKGNGGEVELHANNTTLLTKDSLTSARSEKGGNGGIVKVLGERVGLFDQAQVDVSGDQGGGTALIGGDYQGGNDQIRNANQTVIAPGAGIEADAMTAGDGGEVIVWANESTRFYGDILARGGNESGDGGFAEVSGKTGLVYNGWVDLTANRGDIGLLLLDPKNITINTNISSYRNGQGDTRFNQYNNFSDHSSEDSILNNTVLATQLTTTKVTLQANTDITFENSVTNAEVGGEPLDGRFDNNSSYGTLTLQAGRSIVLMDDVDIALDGANFTAVVNDGGASSGTYEDGANDVPYRTAGLAEFKMGSGSSIKTNGGDITIETGGFDNRNQIGDFTLQTLDSSGTDGGNAGTITLTNSRGNIGPAYTSGDISVPVNYQILANGGAGGENASGGNGGNISIEATNGSITTNDLISASGGNGGVLNNQASTNGGNAGTINLTAGNAINLGGDILASGGAQQGNGTKGDANSISLDVPTITTTKPLNILAEGGFANNREGHIVISDNGNLNTLNLGGNLTLSAGDAADITLKSNVNYNGIGTTGSLTLNAGNNIDIHGEIVDSDTGGIADQLKVALHANVDGGSNGNVTIDNDLNGLNDLNADLIINTGGGNFDVTGINYDVVSDNNGSVAIITNTGNATLVMDGSVQLGRMEIGGNLDVTAGATNNDGNSISQSNNTANDVLVVESVATFTSNATNGNIDLTNNNDLQGNINFTATGDYRAVVELTNNAAVTTLDTVTVAGDFTVNANNDLTVMGAVTGVGSDANNSNSRLTALNLNFGQVDTGGVFTLDGTIIEAGNINDDRVTININGGAGNDTFNINSSANISTINGTVENNQGITIKGADGDDTFNLATNIQGLIDGGAGADSFNLNVIDLNITNIDGGADTDTLSGANEDSLWNITANNDGALVTSLDVNNVPVTSVMFSGIEKLVGGNGDDTFEYGSSATALMDSINGGDHTLDGGDSVDMSALTGIVNLVLGQGVMNVETVTGNNTNSTLIGTANADNFELTGENDGQVDGLTFINFNYLNGGAGDDTFVYQTGGSLTGSLDGGGHILGDAVDMSGLERVSLTLGQLGFAGIETVTGNNSDSTLTGNANPNTFTLTGENDGTVDGLAFIDFNNLNGGAGDDTFVYQPGGSITGSLDGGAHTNGDQVNLSALSLVDLTLGALDFSGIETVTGNNTNSTLTGDASANIFTLTGENDGSVDGLAFIDFNHLNGGAGDDTFVYQPGGSITGSLDGGANGDRVDMSALNVVSLTLGALGFSGIETVTGNNIDSTLTGDAGANTFTLTGENDGSVDGLIFIDFNDLNGGAGDDIFVYQLGGSVTGSLAGGTHTNGDQVNLSALNAVSLTLGALGFSEIETVIGNNTDSTLTGDASANIFTLTGENDGSVDGLTFSDFNHLNGGAGDDIFAYQPGASITGSLGGGLHINGDQVNMSALSLVSLTLGELGFSGIETVIGNNSNSTLTGDASANIFTLTGENDGSVDGLAFINFNQLNGGAGDEIFVYQVGGSVTGALDGGAHMNGDRVDMSALSVVNVTLGQGLTNIESIIGNNTNSTLNGDGVANTFTLTGENDGLLDGLAFIDFNHLNGGAGDDTFVYQPGAGITGLLDGGAHNRGDRVDMSALDTVTLTLGQLGFSNIETITGNNINSTLTGDVNANTFTLTGENDGSVDGLAFIDFNHLNGGAGDDTFIYQTSEGVSGSLDGGAHIIGDRVDMSALDTVILTLGQLGFSNIETITGNNLNSTLIGDITSNTFTLTGENDGSLDGLTFIDFNHLKGGEGDDIFVYQPDGTVTGSLSGGVHTNGDRVDMSALNLVDLTLGALGFSGIETVTGNNTNSTLTGDASANTFTLTGENDGSVDGLAFIDFNHLNGGAGDDGFVFQTGSSLTGILNGGVHSNGDSVNMSALNVVNITLGQELAGVEFVTGNNINSTLSGNANANTFTLTDDNDGTVDGLVFIDFNRLNGGAGDDVFVYQPSGSLSGLLDGGEHINRDIVDMSALASVDVSLGQKLVNIESIIGNNVSSTLTGNADANVFILTGENDGLLDGLAFTDFNFLNGLAGDDSFTFQTGSSLTGVIDGGAHISGDRVDMSALGLVDITLGQQQINVELVVGNNSNSTLRGDAGANTFSLTGENDGRLDALDFVNFNHLHGGDGDDAFTFQADSSLTGLIDGGDHLLNGDSVDMSALTRSLDVQLGVTGDVHNVERIIGNNVINSTLIGEHNNNSWNITGGDSVVDGVVFNGFNVLRGGNADDSFAQSGFSGKIYGGDHDLGDTIDYSNQASINVTVGDAFGVIGNSGIAEIEGIKGNNTNSTLIGENVNNTWNINGENEGLIGTLKFEDFNFLVGGSANDNFVFAPNGSIKDGQIDGGDHTENGADIVNMSALSSVDVQLDTDVMNVELIVGNNTASTLRGRNRLNTWTLTGENEGNVNGVRFVDVNHLVGGSANDDFIFDTGGRLSGMIDGGAQDTQDRVNMSAVGSVSIRLGQDVLNIEEITGNSSDSTLIGENNGNTWTLTGENKGSVDGVNYIAFNKLVGGDGDDHFVFNAGGILPALIDGGGHATQDSVNMAALSRVDAALGREVINVEQITGNGVASTLRGESNANTWTLTGENSGNVDGVHFARFNNLVGGSADDIFVFNAGSSLNGWIDGGAHTSQDSVDVSALDNVAIRLGQDLLNIEQVKGNNVASALIGENSENTWTLTAENDGTVNGLTFVDFNRLVGGNQDDFFVFNTNSSITGQVDGGAHQSQDRINMAALTNVDVRLGENVVNVEQIDGNNTLSTLKGEANANNWTLTGENEGYVDGVFFTDFNRLIGGDADDQFVFSIGSRLTGWIDGGAHLLEDRVDMSALDNSDVKLGQDVLNVEKIIGNGRASRLVGADVNNIWTLTAQNSGGVNDVQFIDFNHLVGGSADDQFVFGALGAVTGSIDGGAHAIQDSLDMSVLENVDIALGVDVVNLEQIAGNNTASVLRGENKANTWTLIGENEGNIDDIHFVGFNHLTGGSANDEFIFDAGSRLSGMIDGGAQITQDQVDMSALSSVDVQLGRDVKNIELIIGNDTDSRLTGDNYVSSWVIDKVNGGNASSAGHTLSFFGFNHLVGGDLEDSFSINGSAVLNGTIAGGAGNDRLNVVLADGQNGRTDFVGGEGDDVILLAGGGVDYQETFTPLATGGEFAFASNASSYAVGFNNVSAIQDDVRADLSVVGTAANDIFHLVSDSFAVNGDTPVVYSGKHSLTFSGMGGVADVIELAGDLFARDEITLSAETIVNSSSNTISTNKLFLNSVNTAGSDNARILTDITDLYISNSGNVYINEQNELNIAQLDASSMVDIIASDNVGSGAILTSDHAMNISSENGDIELLQANQLSGPLGLTASSGAVLFNNSVDTTLANVSANSLVLTLGGNVDATGAVVVSGDAELVAVGGIVLEGDNDFTSVSAIATDISLRDVNAIDLTEIVATGSVNVVAENNLAVRSVRADEIELDAGTGQISDSNGGDVNLVGTRVVLRSATGIGVGNALETQASVLDVVNDAGVIEIQNTGAVTLTNLVTQGDIYFTNDLDVTLDNVDAGYETGYLRMDVTNGSIFGVSRDYRSMPDLTAEDAFINVSTDFGASYRPVSVYVNNEFALFSNVGSVYYYGRKPESIIDNSLIKVSIFDALVGLSGQQLIEVETLAEIDPAIFTEVRNYYQGEISVRLPADQLYDEDEEETSYYQSEAF